MGVSTDAILFYGLCWDDEVELGEASDFETNHFDIDASDNWEEVYRLRTHRTLDYKDPNYEWSDKWPVAISHHCSGDYPMPYVAVQASEVRAWRGSPKEVTSLRVPQIWDQQLREFCSIMKIEWQQPKWWLVSYWG
jgi:hypothetical protein